MTELNIENELQKLGIKDIGDDEDSDVTPTNTPPTPPTIIQYPTSSNTSGFYDGEFFRYSSCDEYDMRTDSSLSWGEDEFEGEATRIVNSLFEQLDQIIYSEDSSSKLMLIPDTKYLRDRAHQRSKKKNPKKLIPVSKNKAVTKADFNVKQFPVIPSHYTYSEQNFADDEAYESFGPSSASIPQPSQALVEECKEWVATFPHFRVNGTGVDIKQLAQLELLAIEEIPISEISREEELIAKDGDYENRLHFVALKSEIPVDKKNSLKKPKGPPSRICSGSNDPDVLKEQILIKLFEMIWPTVTQVVEPLLNKYAHYLINQSVLYSSISREPSTKGNREAPLLQPIPLQVPLSIPPIHRKTTRSTSLTGISRPNSTILKQPSKVPIDNVSKEELENLLHVSSKPLQNYDDREDSRSSSASKVREVSAVSLPLLDHRPVSSKSNSHLLTPRLKADSRPTSTSSFTRLRNNDKYSGLNKTATIEEEKSSYGKFVTWKDVEEELDRLSPPWSRHATTLPPIADVASLVKTTGKRLHEPSKAPKPPLHVKGKALSTTALTNNKHLISPSSEAAKLLITDKKHVYRQW